jgi:integrase/recombinase XerD
MTTTTDFAKYLSRFLSEHLPHERNVSRNTIVSYRDAFVQFIDFMKNEKNIPLERLSLKHLDRDNVIAYLRWLVDERKSSAATRNYRLAAIHSFCKYLQYEVIDKMEQWQKILTIKVLRTEVKAPKYLSIEGIKLLLEQPDRSSWKGRRHLAILSLMYDTGARVQEIADLTVDSVRISSEPYTVRLFGKGRKARIVPLVKEQTNILRLYMEENHLNDSRKSAEPLFYNNRHEKMTREGISYILSTYVSMVRKISPELIPERLSCHSLRHSRAMHLLQAGVNLVYIRDILGHVSIQTTDIYARADSKAKREALERAYKDFNPDGATDRVWEHNKDLREWLKGLK